MSNLDQSLRIGIFDSGIGGFSILKEIQALMPFLEVYYYADTANAPYGPKSPDFVIERSHSIVKYLENHNVSLVVVACNTATAWAIDELRSKYSHIPFVGVEPYINILNQWPDLAKNERPALITTNLTGKSERFKALKLRLDPDSRIDHYCLPHLARIVEEDFFHEMQLFQSKSGDIPFASDLYNMVKSEVECLQGKKYKHLILGCTHYPLVKNSLEKILQLETISPCRAVAQRVESILKARYADSWAALSAKARPEFSFYNSHDRFQKCLPFSLLERWPK